jgi:hypothetical protein
MAHTSYVLHVCACGLTVFEIGNEEMMHPNVHAVHKLFYIYLEDLDPYGAVMRKC